MDFSIEWNDLLSMITSVICGGIIGFERAYKNKSTGFRTIVLITLGSTIFTIVSRHGAGADDRISANIITGIGFIGAGVIFKDKMSVMGLTTAAVIWTAAAIGMTTGIGYHALAVVFTLITLAILLSVNKLEVLIDGLHKSKIVNITFTGPDMELLHNVEAEVKAAGLKSKQIQLYKAGNALHVALQLSGKNQVINTVCNRLIALETISDFH
jgi:putative Mg2+ transporter-C (MgtC) family protein